MKSTRELLLMYETDGERVNEQLALVLKSGEVLLSIA